jgi:hypothetical protein
MVNKIKKLTFTSQIVLLTNDSNVLQAMFIYQSEAKCSSPMKKYYSSQSDISIILKFW